MRIRPCSAVQARTVSVLLSAMSANAEDHMILGVPADDADAADAAYAMGRVRKESRPSTPCIQRRRKDVNIKCCGNPRGGHRGLSSAVAKRLRPWTPTKGSAKHAVTTDDDSITANFVSERRVCNDCESRTGDP